MKHLIHCRNSLFLLLALTSCSTSDSDPEAYCYIQNQQEEIESALHGLFDLADDQCRESDALNIYEIQKCSDRIYIEPEKIECEHLNKSILNKIEGIKFEMKLINVDSTQNEIDCCSSYLMINFALREISYTDNPTSFDPF